MFTIIQDSVKGLNELSEQRGAFGEIILSIGERGSLQIRSDGIFLQLLSLNLYYYHLLMI